MGIRVQLCTFVSQCSQLLLSNMIFSDIGSPHFLCYHLTDKGFLRIFTLGILQGSWNGFSRDYKL